MKILILVLQYPPDVNATGQLMAQLADTWASQGHEVSVITSFPHYEHFRIWPEYRGKWMEKSERENERMGEGELGGDKGTRRQGEAERGTREAFSDSPIPPLSSSPALPSVTRVWVYANGTKNMLNRLASYLSFTILAAVAGVMEQQRWDVILCPNGSFFNGLTGWFLGRGRTSFVYNVQDLYPDVPIHAGQLKNGLAIRWLRGIEKYMYDRAAHVTAISPSIVDAIKGRGINAQKVSMISNFVDTSFIRPLPKANEVSRRLRLDERFVVMQAGYIGYAYDLESLLYAAALVREYDILFVIVGNGVAKEALENTRRALELDNVRFLPFHPRKDLPWLRAAADVQVSLHRHQSAEYSLPSKVYEIMASGRPLLASSDKGSEVWNLIQETGCGDCIEPGQPAKLAEAVLSLYRNPALREAMGKRGRAHAVAHYSKEAVAEQYLTLFEKMMADHSSVRDSRSKIESPEPSAIEFGK